MLNNLPPYRIVPANPLDEVLSDSFQRGDCTALDGINFGTGTADILRAAITLQASPEEFFKLVQFLAGNGLTATALAAVNRALLTVSLNASLCAAFVELGASIKSRIGLEWAAYADHRLIRRLRSEPAISEEMPVVEHERFSIVDIWNQPDLFAELSSRHMSDTFVNDPLRDALAKRIYQRRGFKDLVGSPVELSFFVVDQDNTPVLQVECDALGALRCREAPVIIAALTSDAGTTRSAAAFALRQLLSIASWAGTWGLQLELALDTDIGRELRTRIDSLKPKLMQMVRAATTLSRSPDQIFNSYSENHRRSIRKASKSITITRFAPDDAAALECYRLLYEKTQRVAPLDDVFLTELLISGQHILYGAFMEATPVGLVIVSIHGSSAYYSAGVTAGPEKLPIGHALMHRAIEDARADGMVRFDFGLLDIAPEANAKMKSIARFKLGFCDEVRDRLIANVTKLSR